MTIYDILEIYKPDDSIFSEELSSVHKLKHIIYTRLKESDKRIILLYAEYGSVRQVAKMLHISLSTMYAQLDRIKKTILLLYNH